MAWPVDGRGGRVPERSSDAMSEQEFQDALVGTVVRSSLAMFAGYEFPDVNQEDGRKYHATFMTYFSFFAWKFPSWLMEVASRCPFQDMRREVIKDCVDEEVADPDAGGRCHIDVLYDEAEACGIPRDVITTTQPTPILLACIHALENLSKSLSWQGSYAAISGLEILSSGPAVEIRNKILAEEMTPEELEAARSGRDSTPLSERTGVEPELLMFAALHEYKDQIHGGGGLAIMLKYATSREIQEEMIWAAKAGVEIFAVMREEIDRLALEAIGLPPRQHRQLAATSAA